MLTRPAVHAVAGTAAARPWGLHVPAHRRRTRWVRPLVVVVAVELAVASGALAGGIRATRAGARPPVPAVASAAPVASLLAPSDLGAGWLPKALVPAAEAGSCFAPRAALYSTGPASTQSGSWSTGDVGLPASSEVIASYPSATAATRAFAAVTAAVSGCNGFDYPSAGQPATVAVAPAPVPLLGDRSAAYQVTADVGGSVAGADFVLVQRATHVLLLVYSAAGVPNAARVAALGATATARLGR